MFETSMLFRILISTVLGAIIGLETETREIENNGDSKKIDEKSRIGGVRTYTLISLLGGISGIFYYSNEKVIATLLFLSIVLFLLTAYYLNVQLKQAFGLTTEIAILITFISGFLITSEIVNIEIVLFVLVLLSFFLSNKRGIGRFIAKIRHYEVIDLIKFALVSLVVLPLLPNKDIYLNDIILLTDIGTPVAESMNLILINPFQIWMIVVIISSVSISSHILSRVFGAKNGLAISAFFSGMVSSTSALIAFAGKSKQKSTSSKGAAGAALIAHATSFITISGILFIANKGFTSQLLPFFAVLFISSLLPGIYFLLSDNPNTDSIETYDPFALGPALKFVGLIVILKIFVQLVVNSGIGSGLIVAVTAISGLTGIDAPLIATADLIQDGIITFGIGATIVFLVNTVNYIAKMFYAKAGGTKEFFKYVTFGMLISLASSFIIIGFYVF